MDSSNQSIMNGEIAVPNGTNVFPHRVEPDLVIDVTTKSKLHMIHTMEHISANRTKVVLNSPNIKNITYDAYWSSITGHANAYTHLTDIYRRIKSNTLTVSYRYPSTSKIGRVYPFKGVSLISLPRAIRYALAFDRYVDIDIVNCHPTIIKQLVETYRIDFDCSNSILSAYVDNRDNFLTELSSLYNVPRDTSKSWVIKIIFGGNLLKELTDKYSHISPPSWIRLFQLEIHNIQDVILRQNPNLKQVVDNFKSNGIDRGDNGYLAFYLQYHECRILETVYDYLVEKQVIVNNCVIFCYDGLMILKEFYSDALLRELETIVERTTGFRVQFKVKSMTEGSLSDTYLVKYVVSISNDIPIDTTKDDVEKWYIAQKQIFEYGRAGNTVPIRFKCENFFIERTLRDQINPNDHVSLLNQIDIKSQKHFTEKFMDFSAFENDKNKKVMFYDMWLNDPNKRKFDKLVFDIDKNNTPLNHFNLFDGFEIENNNVEVSDDEILSLIDPLINQNNGLFFNICGANKANMDYLMKVFSGILQNIRPTVMIIFKDSGSICNRDFGGSGKDSAITWFSKKIIGMKYYFECESTEDVVDKFNLHLCNKIVVNIPEISYLIKQRTNWSRMKNMITSDVTVIQGKCQNKIPMANKVTFFASTNDDIIFPYDRRLWVVDVDTSMKNNETYWNNIYEKLADKRVQKAFYMYLTKTIIPYKSPVEYQNNKPITDSMVESKEDTHSFLKDFFVDMIQDESLRTSVNDIYRTSKRKDNTLYIPTVKILNLYSSWCATRYYKCEITVDGLGRILSRLAKELVKDNKPLFLIKPTGHGNLNSYIINITLLKEWYDGLVYREEGVNQSNVVDDSVLNQLRALKSILVSDVDGSLRLLYNAKLRELNIDDDDI